MALLALIFGLTTLNLFVLVQANFSLIARHGAMALIDGGLLQVAELAVYGVERNEEKWEPVFRPHPALT